MISIQTSHFKSDCLDIFYDIYLPDSSLKSAPIIIQIAHGMVEHKGKYEFIAKFLAKSGFIVAVSDHRGHGDSINAKDNLAVKKEQIYHGEMGENGFERAVEDMFKLSEILKSRFKPQKFILIGHSMGSLLARRFLQIYGDKVDGLILCGTPKPMKSAIFGIYILKILRFFGINNIAQKLAYRLSFLSFNAKFYKDDKLDSGKQSGILWVNRDICELQRTLQDAKCRFIFSVNSFICLLGGLLRVYSKYPKPLNPNLPILFISGEDDACGGFGVGVVSALKHISKNGYQNAKMILYSGARHELFLELNKNEVASDVKCWIDWNF